MYINAKQTDFLSVSPKNEHCLYKMIQPCIGHLNTRIHIFSPSMSDVHDKDLLCQEINIPSDDSGLCGIMSGSRGVGGRGSMAPLKNHTAIGVLSNIGPDPLENYKATKPAFNVGPSLVGQ